MIGKVNEPANLLERDPPYKSIVKALEIFKNNKLEGIIFEIGCCRGRLRYKIEEESLDKELDLDGHSTIYFAASGMDTISVDIEESNVKVAREDINIYYPKHNCRVICGDGLAVLKELNTYTWKDISLLYLDAWDVNLPDSSEKHLEALALALPYMALSALILIDDTDVDHIDNSFVWSDGKGGKGKLAIRFAEEHGFKVIYSGRQTLLGRNIVV